MEVKQKEVEGADKGGNWVTLGEVQYKVAPLNFKALRELGGTLGLLREMTPGEMPSTAHVTALVAVAHASLRRNYPSITEDEVADVLDFGNFSEALSSVLGVSGLRKKEEGQDPGK